MKAPIQAMNSVALRIIATSGNIPNIVSTNDMSAIIEHIHYDSISGWWFDRQNNCGYFAVTLKADGEEVYFTANEENFYLRGCKYFKVSAEALDTRIDELSEKGDNVTTYTAIHLLKRYKQVMF